MVVERRQRQCRGRCRSCESERVERPDRAEVESEALAPVPRERPRKDKRAEGRQRRGQGLGGRRRTHAELGEPRRKSHGGLGGPSWHFQIAGTGRREPLLWPGGSKWWR